MVIFVSLKMSFAAYRLENLRVKSMGFQRTKILTKTMVILAQGQNPQQPKIKKSSKSAANLDKSCTFKAVNNVCGLTFLSAPLAASGNKKQRASFQIGRFALNISQRDTSSQLQQVRLLTVAREIISNCDFQEKFYGREESFMADKNTERQILYRSSSHSKTSEVC